MYRIDRLLGFLCPETEKAIEVFVSLAVTSAWSPRRKGRWNARTISEKKEADVHQLGFLTSLQKRGDEGPKNVLGMFFATAVTLLAMCLATSAAAAEVPPIPIRIGWQVPTAIQAQIAQVLKRTNVLELHGFEPRLVPFSFGTPEVEAALQGKLDAAFVGDQSAIDMISQGARWKIVARLYYDRVAVLVPRNSTIQQTGDLRGKEVATPFGSTAHRELTIQERAAGIDPDRQVNNRDMDILEIGRHVLSGGAATWGEVDAVAVWEPMASQFELEQRARTLDASRTLGVIALSEEFIASHPEAAVQFLIAVKRAWLYFARHAQRVMGWYIDEVQLGYSPEALLSAARFDANFNARTLGDIDLRLSNEDVASLQRAVEWGRQRGYVAGNFQIRSVVDEGVLRRASAVASAQPLEPIEVIFPTAREMLLADLQDTYFIDRFPLWTLFVLMIAISFLAIEVGQQVGRRRIRHKGREPEGPIGTAVGAVLALLAFVIALTFSAAGSRFDARKQALLDEVNAIGTAYLRADLLPEPQRTTTRLLFRDYVEARLGIYRVFDQPDKLSTLQGRTSALQESIWSRAEELDRIDQRSQVYALFTASVNDVFDLHTKRVVLGAEYRIPLFVWYALGLVSVLAMSAVGFQFGISGKRSLMATVTLSLTFALVILLILDLDRPGAGLIDVNQRPMMDLYQSLGRQGKGV